jgi:hypothetical protein
VTSTNERTGLVRAAIHAIRSKVDLINMSYGEEVALPNQGRFIQLAKDLVRSCALCGSIFFFFFFFAT